MITHNKMVRTRIPPSPTGMIHIGTIEIALMNYAYAKQNNGKFILRLEDTDRTRYVEGGDKEVYEMLNAYGLIYDEGPDVGGEFGPYVQSERLEIYKKYINELIEKDIAYYCFCTKEELDEMRREQEEKKQKIMYDRRCRKISKEVAEKRIADGEKFVVRLKIPDDQVIEQTVMFGNSFEFNSNDLDDQILLKSDGYPTYYLGVVVDDHLMGITHVFKGKEWQSSDPKLIILYKAFGWELPKFGYLPLLLDPDAPGKLSKRKGSTSARSYLEEGFLPEAVLNYLMLILWNPGDEREIFSLDEFIKEFKIEKLNPANASFDKTKLTWLNGKYLRNLDDETYAGKFKEWMMGYGKSYSETKSYNKNIIDSEKNYLVEAIKLEKERAKTFKEMVDALELFFTDEINIDTEDKSYKKFDKNKSKDFLNDYLMLLDNYKADNSKWNHETWEKDIRELADKYELKHGDAFMMIRLAVAGKSVSPELFSTMSVIGLDKTINRIKNYIAKLN